MRYLVRQHDGLPYMQELPDWSPDGYVSKAIAVKHYVSSQKLDRREFLQRINNNMNRVAAIDRRIRAANKFLEV